MKTAPRYSQLAPRPARLLLQPHPYAPMGEAAPISRGIKSQQLRSTVRTFLCQCVHVCPSREGPPTKYRGIIKTADCRGAVSSFLARLAHGLPALSRARLRRKYSRAASRSSSSTRISRSWLPWLPLQNPRVTRWAPSVPPRISPMRFSWRFAPQLHCRETDWQGAVSWFPRPIGIANWQSAARGPSKTKMRSVRCLDCVSSDHTHGRRARRAYLYCLGASKWHKGLTEERQPPGCHRAQPSPNPLRIVPRKAVARYQYPASLLTSRYSHPPPSIYSHHDPTFREILVPFGKDGAQPCENRHGAVGTVVNH